jgi:glucan phosphoethanolaminetransferase (alkaline phosphatase superfamily)
VSIAQKKTLAITLICLVYTMIFMPNIFQLKKTVKVIENQLMSSLPSNDYYSTVTVSSGPARNSNKIASQANKDFFLRKKIIFFFK